MAMNPEIKNAWIENLLSGKFEQGQQVLHNEENDTYCCLGVLCEMAVDAGVVTGVAVTRTNGVQATKYDKESTVLPTSVMEWAGIEQENPDTPIGGTYAGRGLSLAELNDDGNPNNEDTLDEYGNAVPYTFEQIAAVIRDHL